MKTHLFIAPDHSWFLGYFTGEGVVRKHMLFDQATSGESFYRHAAIENGFDQWRKLHSMGLIDDAVPERIGEQFERVVALNVKVLGFGK